MRVMIVFALAGSLLQAATSDAAARNRVGTQAAQVSVELTDARGRLLPSYAAASVEGRVYRAYVEARLRQEYSIRVHNPTDRRVGVVIAVDGRNIVSGERSDLAPDEAMYVVDPGQTAVYAGWRTSANEVRRFYFSEPGDSYASRIGDESAIGVVAAAVFPERRERDRPYARSEDAAPAAPRAAAEADAAGRAERSMRAGTGFGDAARSHSIRVVFTPEQAPARRVFLKYEWTEQLCLRGIRRCAETNRFWPEDGYGFVPLPPGEPG